MFRKLIFLPLCSAVVFTASTNASAAQDAFIAQVGNSNIAVNAAASQVPGQQYISQSGTLNGAVQLSTGAKNRQVTVQSGELNASLHAAVGAANAMATAQIGYGNVSLTRVAGRRNVAGTAQLGLKNSSSISIVGSGNNVGTLQVGALHQSNVNVFGNDTDVSVAQFGFGRETNLTVVDELNLNNGGPVNNLNAQINGTNRLQVGVIQGGLDQPVNALVGRDSGGNVIIRPGSATTVLTF